MAKDEKPKTQSGTPAGTEGTKGGVDLATLVAAASSMAGNTQKGPVFTRQDATSYVQSIYQQMLGRNAVGAELTRGINVFLNQARDTDVSGRQQAILSQVQSGQEYRRRQENKYLDAIYGAVAEDVRRAQG